MKRTWALFLLIPFFFACSSSNEAPPLSPQDTAMERAGQCVDSGDLNCAQKSYCELRAADESDIPAGLRCCVSMFLNAYFSENTRELGKMLGYQPADFSEIKKTSLQELLSKKKLPFGELAFLSASEAPQLKVLFTDWAKSLVTAQVSTSLLSQRVRALGDDLEAVHICLEKIAPKFEGEEALEPRFFGAQDKISVTPHDLRFFQFASGGISYLAQSVFQYEWGFDRFPAWPPVDSFYQDINGHLSAGDLRFGDLSDSSAQAIVSHSDLLQESFNDFRFFLKDGSASSRIDQWLAWRFSQGSLAEHRDLLAAAADSLDSRQWVKVPGSDYSVNLSSLLQVSTLPDASGIPAGIDLLVKDEHQAPTVNLTYFSELFKNLAAQK